jgi:DNA-binding MarR family transcriptional regulator
MRRREPHEEVAEITRTVRLLYHQLKALGAALHADTGVTVPMRGVLETIHRDGPATVPHMARLRPVSRQHIQRIVDELLELGLVWLDINPDHKRSPLVSLTEKGRATFESMAQRELTLFQELSWGLPKAQVLAAKEVLGEFRTRLSALLAREAHSTGDDHDEDL